MAFLQWRRFNFFNKDIVKERDGKLFEKLKDININSSTSGRGYLTFGDVEGQIYLLNRQLELHCFKAYELTVSHLQQLRQVGILISVGGDVPGNNSLVKIWNLDKQDKNGNPICTRSVSALPANKETPVTALAVSETMNFMVLGYENGSVLLLKGDITRDKGSKQKVIHEGQHSITALAFRNIKKSTHLFISTSENVYSYNISLKEKELQFHLDDHGCSQRCSTLSDAKLEYQFVIARDEALYFYQPDGRGPCLAFDGEKILVHWFRGYLVVVGKDRSSVQQGAAGGSFMKMNIVTVYDIQNKFIAYSAPLPEVIDVLSEWGSLYVLGGDNKLYQLQEKDTQSKLNMLFKKSLYALAIELAKSQQYDEDGVIDIFRQYGDHLYNKGDHTGAIEQYIKTIGKLEASYVIRKFLDAQRIENLTAYLQALHKQRLATEDHTTLLLNCYTKLRDEKKLVEFIVTKEDDIGFDTEIAIRVCRQAGYYRHALYLAEKHHHHDLYLKIQIEDLKQFENALNYISRLDFEAAESNMRKYGKVLLTEVTDKTTEFLKQLCKDYRPSEEPIVDSYTLDGSVPQVKRAEAKQFIHIFVQNSKKLQEFLEHVLEVQPESESLMYNTLIELYLHEYVHDSPNNVRIQKQHEDKIMKLLRKTNAKYDVDQALMLCRMNNFTPGLLFLYEKAKLYQQILQYYMDREQHQKVLSTCEQFGAQDPNLWVQALCYFSKTGENQKEFLVKVLQNIKDKKLLSPLMVIRTLANSSTATLAIVKDYITSHLQKENEQIEEDKRRIEEYRQKTEKMKQEIEDIKNNPKIFKVSKCSACNQQLELPSVHFLCHHSYHMHCFESYSDNDQECPACSAENRKILDIIRSQEQSKDLHEEFHHELEKADDGFSVVSEYFGRGIFNRVTLITDLLPKPRIPSLHPQEFNYNSTISPSNHSLPPIQQFRTETRRNTPPSSLNPFESPKHHVPNAFEKRQPALNPFEKHQPGANPFESPTGGPNPFSDDYDDALNPFKS